MYGLAFEGADVEALEALSKRLDLHARELAQIEQQIDRLMGATAWRGQRGDRFRSEWRGPDRRRLSAAGALLSAMATSLKAQASEQRTASGATGSGIPGGAAIGARDRIQPRGWSVANRPPIVDLLGPVGAVLAVRAAVPVVQAALGGTGWAERLGSIAADAIVPGDAPALTVGPDRAPTTAFQLHQDLGIRGAVVEKLYDASPVMTPAEAAHVVELTGEPWMGTKDLAETATALGLEGFQELWR